MLIKNNHGPINHMPERFMQLISQLKGKDLALKIESVLELGRLRDERAIGPLSEALKDDGIRALVCWALGRIGSKASMGKMLRLLVDDDAKVRHEAVLALARIGDSKAAGPIAKLLKLDKVAKVREECAEALAAFPSKAALAALKKAAAEDSSLLVRDRANKSIVEIRMKELGIEQNP